MCMVSMVGDQWRDRWTTYPWWPADYTAPPLQPKYPEFDWSTVFSPAPTITREEFDALKADVAEMKEMLAEAKRQDDAEGTPLCENAQKMEVLRAVAALVGVSLDDVLGPKSEDSE